MQSTERRPLSERVFARASTLRPLRSADVLEALVPRYVAGLEPAAVDAIDRGEGLDDLCGGILSLAELARTRRPEQPEIRIFNPTDEHDGWSADHTVIEIVNDDMPFLVDSVTGCLGSLDLGVHQVIHPQLAAERDEDGNLVRLLDPAQTDGELPRESLMHVEIDRQTAEAHLLEIHKKLSAVLADVRVAVADWQAMRGQVVTILETLTSAPPPGMAAEELAEGVKFLAWLNDNHFTFLGYRRYRLVEKGGRELLRPEADSGLGLMRELSLGSRVAGDRSLSAAAAAFFHGPALVTVTKSTHRATVHRPVHMDLISIKRFDERGEVIGEHRLQGLFTAMAYSIAAHDIPLVGRKVERVKARARLLPASHDAKALGAILEHYPRDELFQISEDDLFRFALRILRLQLNPKLALLVRVDEGGRFASCLVYVPRERHTTGQRLRMKAILEEAFEGTVTAFDMRISDQPLALLRFIVKLDPRRRSDALDIPAIEARLAAVARSWSDELKEAMVARFDEAAGLAEWRRYRDAFPVAYQEHGAVADALADMSEIDRVLRTGRQGMRLYRVDGAAANRFHARTFERGVPASLSTFLPMFENMGLVVLGEMPFEVRPEDAVHPVWIRDFELAAPVDIDPDAVGENFLAAFARLWTGEIENDAFNRLVLRVGLDWRQVVLLRAYGRYLRQAGMVYSQRFMAETLERHPEITAAIVELFAALLDPTRQDEKREARCEALDEAIRHGLEGVSRLDEDRILRRFLALVRHTLRTNYFQATAAGNPKPYLALKLDAEKLPELPAPRPRYEIFVYAPRFEAVHLRGGKVARGGIRWSDRPEDFRTEILGLVKAQMVKNAVIVPVGAKGGFVLKKPPAGDRQALVAEAQACYQDMIRGLLDLTDDYRRADGDSDSDSDVGGGETGADTVVPPPAVVRRDGDDPYLVVAADKGTATFSDLANAAAAEYGYWLGDAFASGGSAGYDHKKMGITARGAWESVKEHFRALGVDIQRQPFTAVGVGDMSGDVFGNGMLLSETTLLLGAFNHLHVFVDPDPDPATALAERRRMFDQRLGWDGYDRAKLSPGGAVFERSAKRIEPSEEVRALLGLTDVETTPDALIRALLAADVDLLFFGGIGTYVKAREESHGAVGDRANDELRLDAHQLRAKVIGEGANLAVTQAGRVAFAHAGGRINTDFIDNSGGVDTSDHEVNIKIALDDAIAAGDLEGAARGALLAEMTDEVAALVLRDNYQQARALSLSASRAVEMMHEHLRLIHELERDGGLDRQLEGLPDDAALLERRDAGLTRPELAVLLAHAKIAVKRELLDSDLPDAPELLDDLLRYFPAPMRERVRPAIERHRLRREIVATHVANSMVNRVGPTFVHRVVAATGRAPSEVARAYTIAREVYDLRAIWEQLEALDSRVDLALLIELGFDAIRLVERATRWFLRYGARPLEIASSVAAYRREIAVLAGALDELAPGRLRAILRRRARRLNKRKVPMRLARRMAGLTLLPSACDVVLASRAAEVGTERAAQIYFALGERFLFDRLRTAARRMRIGDTWESAALSAAVEDFYADQAELTRQVLAASDARPKRAIAAWAASRATAVARIDRLLGEMQVRGRLEVPMLTVAARELHALTTA